MLIPIDELVGEAQARRYEQKMSDLCERVPKEPGSTAVAG